MNAGSTTARLPDGGNPIGGRVGPWLGGLMLLHLAFQSTLKILHGTPEQIFWLSCAVLLLGGMGLMLRNALLIESAVTAGLMLHLLWIIDALSWILLGHIPLGAAGYLPHASAAQWLGTSYHFYAMPTLLIIAMRWRLHSAMVAPMTLALIFALTVGSRALLPASANINCAFELKFGRTIHVLDAVNRLSGPLYLLAVSLGTWVLLMMPVHLGLGVWSRRDRSEFSTGQAQTA